MKQRLIEIKKDTHYIVVDDSDTIEAKIKEGDWVWYNKTIGKLIFAQDDLGQGYELQVGGISYPIYDPLNLVKKITYSTQPIELVDWENGAKGKRPAFDKIKPLSLSEVEEAILKGKMYVGNIQVRILS